MSPVAPPRARAQMHRSPKIFSTLSRQGVEYGSAGFTRSGILGLSPRCVPADRGAYGAWIYISQRFISRRSSSAGDHRSDIVCAHRLQSRDRSGDLFRTQGGNEGRSPVTNQDSPSLAQVVDLILYIQDLHLESPVTPRIRRLRLGMREVGEDQKDGTGLEAVSQM